MLAPKSDCIANVITVKNIIPTIVIIPPIRGLNKATPPPPKTDNRMTMKAKEKNSPYGPPNSDKALINLVSRQLSSVG